VNETLDSIVSPAVRDTLLAEALSAASLNELPVDTRQLLSFFDGPLRRVLERALGPELGSSVTEELGRLSEGLPLDRGTAKLAGARDRAPRSRAGRESLLPRAEHPTRSDAPLPGGRRFTLPAGTDPSEAADAPNQPSLSERERMSRAPTQPSQPAVRYSEPRPPVSGDFPSGTAEALGMQEESSKGASARRLPIIFVATRDPELVRRFTTWLDPRAVVVRVARLIDLLLDLDDIGSRRTVIVFDQRRPPFRPEALAGVAEELPEDSRVLLWGTSREAQTELTRVSTRVTRWIACPEGMPLADVVDRCAELVG